MTNTVVSSLSETAAASLPGKYLTFILGRESYGIPVLKVREIIRYTTPTIVPQLPEYAKGVINLRGKIIPVVDLRLRLKIPLSENSAHTCIIVVQVTSIGCANSYTGMIVDGIEEVTQLSSDEIELAPSFAAGVNTNHLLGMAKVKGTVKTLLNIDTLLANDNHPNASTAKIASC